MKKAEMTKMLSESLTRLLASALDFVAEITILAINQYYTERGASPPFPDPIKRDGE